MEKKEFELSLRNDYYAVCANSLIKASQRMTLREMQLIQLAISQIKRDDTKLNTYTTTASELARFLNVDITNIYKHYDHITDSLMGNVIKIQDGDEIKKFQWVSYCSYNKKTHEIKIRLHDELKPFLMGLKKLYTQIPIERLIGYKSYYTLRLYQLLVCEYGISKKSHYELTIPEIRDFYGIEQDKYTRSKDLLKKTIAVAIEELNEKDYCIITNYVVNHDTRKKGTPVISVSFDVKDL